MNKFVNDFINIMLGALILIIPFYVGYFYAKNDGINPLVQILLGVITLAIADYKTSFKRKN